MKTQFSRRPRSIVAWLTTPASLVVVLILVIVLFRFVFPGTLSALVQPLWSVGAAGARVALPENQESVRAERDALAAQVEILLAEKFVLEQTLKDVAMVASDGPGLSSRVLVRPPVTPYDVLIIDAGTVDAVAVGQDVYGPAGTPLGVITDARPSRSTVLLYSAGGKETQAQVGEEAVSVTLVGQGSGAFFATAASDAPINEGDVVRVKGSVLGSVLRVDKQASSPEAVIRIRPLVSPFTLSWVRVATELP